MNKILIFISIFLVLSNCTSSKWVVVDTQAIDEDDQAIVVSSSLSLVVNEAPTRSTPFFRAVVREINQTEYTQRILAERTLQRYEPKWGFSLLSMLGASLSFYAGNTNDFILTTRTQAIALNATGVLLSTLAATNLKPVGEPIRTGERKFLRSSGTVLRTDTTATNLEHNMSVDLFIYYEGEQVLSQPSYVMETNELNVHIASLLEDRVISGPEPGNIEISLGYQDTVKVFSYPVETFMSPVIYITAPATDIRSIPEISNESSLTEIGLGSELAFLNEANENWYEVQFGGSNVYIDQEAGEIRWRNVQNGPTPTVVTIEETPFGQLNIENSVPVLRESGDYDYAFIFSNDEDNQIGQRRYLDREFDLIQLYFRNALDIPVNHQYRIHVDNTGSWSDEIESVAYDSTSSLFVYIGGYANVVVTGDQRTVMMTKRNPDGTLGQVPLENILLRLAEKNSQKLIVFVDLQFNHPFNTDFDNSGSTNGRITWLQLSNRVTRVQPNTALIFSSRTDQASGVYANERFENMYHHIFPYYLALGLQSRITRINNLVQYLENQVDYTSRRLFDRPQEVHSFGNLTINLAN